MLVRLNTCMHAIFKKPLNLANEILNLEQKQDVSAGLLNLMFGYLTKTMSEINFVSVKLKTV